MNTPKNNKATDKGCCEKCQDIGSGPAYDTYESICNNYNCPCHQSPTPSLSEGEEWEKEFFMKFIWQSDITGTIGKEMCDFIKGILSQERQRIVQLGEELKREVPDYPKPRLLQQSVEIGLVEARNLAFTHYQQKIKSLNS